jgi:hypothetical protein
LHTTLHMRRDFVLPVLLLVALMAMALYATSGRRRSEPVGLAGTPAPCQVSGQVRHLAELGEASGLAASKRTRSVLWSHNDSADSTLYAIGTDGSVAGRVRVAGASVVDWEAVTVGNCSGGSCVFVGDIGDNDRKRRRITVYRTPEPLPSDRTTAAVEVVEASYPEGPQDAESLFVARGMLFVVTKGENAPVRVYRFPSGTGGSAAKLELVATLTENAPGKSARVTDAAVSPNGHWIAMRTNDLVLFYQASSLLSGLADTPLIFDLRPLKEPQGEGITWRDDQTLFLAGEAAGGGTFARMSCNLPLR